MEPDKGRDGAGRDGVSRDSLDPQLHAWLDGELAGEEREEVEGRLGSDAAARGDMELLERCEEWLATSTPEPPPDLPARIQRAIHGERESRVSDVGARRRRRMRATLWIAALSAASVAVLVFLWLGGPARGPVEPGPWKVASAPLLQVDHEFFLAAPEAKEVCLVGDFNGWEVCKTPMIRDAGGLWKIRLNLTSGRHEYMFVVDGRWVTDPRAAMRIDDGFGSQNGVVLL